MKRLEYTNKNQLKEAIGLPFAAMDPGREGYLLTFLPGLLEVVDGASPMIPESCYRAMRATRRARVLVQETQFIGNLKAARSVIELAYTTGVCVGWLSCQMEKSVPTLDDGAGYSDPPRQLLVYEVAPATWQAYQHREHGEKRAKESGIRLAMEVAEENLGRSLLWRGADNKRRTGIAAAYGIAQWWQSLIYE